jgi:hypothetical protein
MNLNPCWCLANLTSRVGWRHRGVAGPSRCKAADGAQHEELRITEDLAGLALWEPDLAAKRRADLAEVALLIPGKTAARLQLLSDLIDEADAEHGCGQEAGR